MADLKYCDKCKCLQPTRAVFLETGEIILVCAPCSIKALQQTLNEKDNG
jgi:hypothetical protein